MANENPVPDGNNSPPEKPVTPPNVTSTDTPAAQQHHLKLPTWLLILIGVTLLIIIINIGLGYFTNNHLVKAIENIDSSMVKINSASTRIDSVKLRLDSLKSKADTFQTFVK